MAIWEAYPDILLLNNIFQNTPIRNAATVKFAAFLLLFSSRRVTLSHSVIFLTVPDILRTHVTFF